MGETRIPLLYKDRRVEGDTPVRQAQLIALHLLEVLKAICERHGLRYWLTYGTLIGALRHKGFIPWDDDLDVWMLDDDCKKFIEIARSELPLDVYLECPGDNSRMENGIIRLRDNYSTALVKHSRNVLVNDHHGVSIDIFPLYRSGSNNRVCNAILHQYETTYGKWRRSKYGSVTCIGMIKKLFLFFWTWSMFCLWKLLDLFCVNKPYLITRDWYLGYKFWYPAEWIVGNGDGEIRTAEFEGEVFPVPAEPELALSKEYDDYLRLPPEEMRTGYYAFVLPTTPCFHPSAMTYPHPEIP